MRRSHAMPFGARIEEDGSVRFRLWAPAARRVGVALDGPAPLPMQVLDDGWYELITGGAGPGSLYRFIIDDGTPVPDPASRFQPDDVHGPSQVVDPRGWEWRDERWRGRPWEECVLYELHVGAFTPQGSYRAVAERLDFIAGLGVTAVELMPVADFPGRRNWGYDGVLPFAPDAVYGRPDDLKYLVQCAHDKGLMVFLDVVFNHFGPEGSYLHQYAPSFFTGRHHTPWGAALNYDGPGSAVVRDFFIHNALYWLEEYHFDGLRFDAVHAIMDDSRPDILTELAERVRAGPGAERHIHLVLENDDNNARYLDRDASGRPGWYAAQWNDDIHHALHVLLTGEDNGYYRDYADDPMRHLGRCLVQGFAFQGEPSPYRDNRPRGAPSGDLPPTAFVSFLQNHDQVGNRAFGERITALAAPEAVRAATAIVLLSPQIPLLFMGQEWGSRQPFPFFCDFGPDLAATVTEGRRLEFSQFDQFRDPDALARIPDPNQEATFRSAVLDWSGVEEGDGRDWCQFHREILTLRRRVITPRAGKVRTGQAGFNILHGRVVEVIWPLADRGRITLVANLGDAPLQVVVPPAGDVFYTTHAAAAADAGDGYLPPWYVRWYLSE